jgi:ACR3 family arsenite efflux pump ArsB
MFRLKSLWKQIAISLVLNWIIGPFVCFTFPSDLSPLTRR